MKKLRLLLLYGGRSAEHDISIQSAETIAGALDRKRYDLVSVYIDRQGRWLLQPRFSAKPRGGTPVATTNVPKLIPLGNGSGGKAIDVAFPALHGPHGEDGLVQGVLETASIPYVGPGVLGSAIGMDKELSKRLAAAAGLRVPPHVSISAREAVGSKLAAAKRLGFPLYVKPSRLGSSVGVRRVSKPSELAAAVRNALRFDTVCLIEKGVEGLEVAVAVLGAGRNAIASVPGSIVTKGHDFFDYEAKYFDPHGHELAIPARLPKAKLEELRSAALRAFAALEGYGMARVDFLLDPRGAVHFGEVNTIPGFTSHSLYPKLWEASGLTLPKLLDRLVELALSRAALGARLKSTPD
jgi:D-alanine-D-alanine ligase